jgi:HK97 family phage portal protein
VDGKRCPTTGSGRLIAFETGAPGALDHGAQTISTALALETAARNYADSPTPAVVLQSQGLDLDEDEAEELLGKWAWSRRRKSTAYLNSQVKAEPIGFSSQELQLVEGRQHMAIEVARVLNLDSYWVGAQAAGSSVTYTNEQDRRAALLDFTIMPIARVMEQRLSMADVSGGNRELRFSTMGFLRANLAERVAALTAYVTAGIMTIDEARAIEPLVQIGDTPQ